MRKIVAVLTAGVLLTSELSLAQAPAGNAWETVRDLPPGTRLKLRVVSGGEVTGSVVSTTSDSVVMKDNVPGRIGVSLTNLIDGQLMIARADISTATVERMVTQYRANGTPNPNAVRHVVTALGVGQKVQVQIRSGARVTGTISATNGDSFALNRNGRPMETIAYSDVDRISKSGMRGWVTGAILAGSVVGSVLVALGICYSSGRCAGR